MKFSICSSLYYTVSGPSTVLCSLSCSQTAGQEVTDESLNFSLPANRTEIAMGLDGNHFTKLEIDEPGELQVQYSARVETSSGTIAIKDLGDESVRSIDAEALPYLFPSRYAPADRMRDVTMELFGDIEGKYNVAMAVEDWLFENVEYEIGSSGEQSWALDTFEQGAGVCRDFAHLGIAFCRALTIPARYCTVYSYQLEPQDFHAVFEVYIDGKWYLVDGTRKAPLNGMVRIATGRDASDAAVATLFGEVMGQGIAVDVQIAENCEDVFEPVTRETLQSEEKAFFLS